MNPSDPLRLVRLWWRDFFGDDEGPLEGDTPAWAVSLAIHLAVLLGLALVSLGEPPKSARNATVIEAPLAAEEEIELAPQEMAVSEDSKEDQGAESERSDAMAQSLAPTEQRIGKIGMLLLFGWLLAMLVLVIGAILHVRLVP